MNFLKNLFFGDMTGESVRPNVIAFITNFVDEAKDLKS